MTRHRRRRRQAKMHARPRARIGSSKLSEPFWHNALEGRETPRKQTLTMPKGHDGNLQEREPTATDTERKHRRIHPMSESSSSPDLSRNTSRKKHVL